MIDGVIKKLVRAKHLAVDILEEAFDRVDEFDMDNLDLTESFAKLDEIVESKVPAGMRTMVLKELKKIVSDIFDAVRQSGFDVDTDYAQFKETYMPSGFGALGDVSARISPSPSPSKHKFDDFLPKAAAPKVAPKKPTDDDFWSCTKKS